jgi:DNA-binding XRE family transcriptional regulator
MTNSLQAVNDFLIAPRGIFRRMETPADRLRKLRKQRYEFAQDAADAMGVNRQTYAGHENGTTPPTRNVQLYANFFNVPVDFILTGKFPKGASPRVPVVSYIGAGAELFPVDDHPKGHGLELVEAPYGYPDCVAARVKGDSMYPTLREGWLIFWRRDQDGVPEECFGQLCVVQVKDGPLLVKDLFRGTRKNLFTLQSINAPPRENVPVEWAAKVIDIRPA